MRYFITIVSVLLIISCNNQHTEKKESNTITVSILPQKYFVEQIAGDLYDVNVMIPPGGNPVTYEPTTSQLKALSKSKIYFKIGHVEFEKAWISRFQSLNSNLQVYDNSKGIELLSFDEECTDHEHEGHHHHGIDPHIWNSPKAVKLIARNITDALSEVDNVNALIYESNYTIFLNKLDSLDQLLSSSFNNLENKKFIMFHPALGYFARDYDLIQISIEDEGKEPSPGHIKNVIDIAKKDNISIVFVQKQFPTHEAEAIASEINGNVIFIDPLSYDWYSNMMNMATEIRKTLTKSENE